MLPDDELELLVFGPESQRVERKRSAADGTAIRKAICAFANDIADTQRPGVVVIGIEDDGRCAGVVVTDELIRNLAGMRDDGHLQPLPSIQVTQRNIRQCEVVVIEVQPSDSPPMRYRGSIYVRIGSTNRIASPEEERRLLERRRAGDLPFDRRGAHESNLDDLDLDFFREEYLPNAVDTETLDQDQRPLEHQLGSLRFIAGSTPTYGALIVMGRDPLEWVGGAYVQFLRIDGRELGDPVKDEKRIAGPLYQIVLRLEEILSAHIESAVEITGRTQEFVSPNYPIDALHQVVRNALIHRNYEGTNAPVRINWFSDRIEIQNPGGLYGQVTNENFGQGITDYRNPLIAEAMGVLGYVQQYGYGIPLARKLLNENGNPEPEFTFEPTYVLVTIRARQ
jgi:ATP-dependent DNA helicase RecG